MGLGFIVMFEYVGTILGVPQVVDWRKLDRKGMAAAFFLMLPCIVGVTLIAVPVAIVVYPFKRLRDVVFYSKEDRRTPTLTTLFRAAKIGVLVLSGKRELEFKDNKNGESEKNK